jgi:endonuclease G
MKKSTQNIITLLILVIFAVVLYFYWDSQQKENIQGDVLTPSVKKAVIKEFKAFDLPLEIVGHQVVVRPYYTLSFNKEHMQADWVAYKMYPFPDSVSVKRKDAFRVDPMIDGGSATLEDYKKSGYDRGHLAPAKALSYSKESMSESFFMSNMSPQVPMFNRGIWRFLEAEVYQWSKDSDSLYVVTGPVLDHPLGTIGVHKVSIPRSYFKTIIRFKNGNATGIGFLLKNEKSKEKCLDFATSIDSVEQVTGLDFYHQLNDSVEAVIERNRELSKFIKSIE